MIDVDDEFTGIVIEKLSARKAELKDMGPSGAGKTRISLMAPSRSLIGYQGEFLTDTRGSGVLNRVFSHYEPYKGAIDAGRKGVLVSNSDGETAAFALWNLEDRGFMFVGAGEKTYQGMIIGENSRGRRPRRQSDEGQAADQRPRLRQGRGRPPDPAAPPDPGTGHRLHRGRRAGRGDAEVDPPAQEGPQPLLPQEARQGRARRRPGGCGTCRLGARHDRCPRRLPPKPPRHYPTPAAKCADLVVHVVGLTLALVGGVVLLTFAVRDGSITQVVGVSIYAAGVLAMLGFSTAYNFAKAKYRPCCAGSTMPASS